MRSIENKEINIKQNKVVNEILNDAFALGFVLELKRLISDVNHKEILSSFLIFFSSIFCEETITSGFGGLSGKRDVTLKQIEELRNYNLKYCPSINSDKTRKVVTEMGIDFSSYVFDIILRFDSNELIDINFRNWKFNKKEYFELLDGSVATPLRWLEILMPEIYPLMKKAMQPYYEKYIFEISKWNINNKIYSTHKLFAKSKLSNDEKVYILNRFGLIKNVLILDKMIKDMNVIINIGPFKFDLFKYILKCKAVLIEMLWNDYKSNNLEILDKIFETNKQFVPKCFYSINRRIRNNLHYSQFDEVSEMEIKDISEYQDIYLENVLNIFKIEMTCNFGFKYKLALLCAKIRYWSEH